MAEIISDNQIVSDLANAFVSRTQEVYSYEANIQNYTQILASSAGVLPERLSYLSALGDEQAMIECPIEDLPILAEVHQHKRVSYLIRTEAMERAKAQSILTAIGAQLDSILDAEQKELVIQEALARLQGAVS
jgi:hypothetical protein